MTAQTETPGSDPLIHIESVDALEALYGTAIPVAVEKPRAHITPLYQRWIEASKFLILSTVGPEGTDASPRGDDGPVVKIHDAKTLMLPDWRGNNRIDSLRNIVRDDRVSLMFMVNGSNNVVRVNGRAKLSADPRVTGLFKRGDKAPKSVTIVTVVEVYYQCAKALIRSKLWATPERAPNVPTAGDFVKEFQADFDGKAYDAGYSDYAKERLW